MCLAETSGIFLQNDNCPGQGSRLDPVMQKVRGNVVINGFKTAGSKDLGQGVGKLINEMTAGIEYPPDSIRNIISN